MDIQTLVNELNIIFENEIHNNIIYIYRKLNIYLPYIKNYASNDLYMKLENNIIDIQYEIVFGNNDIYTTDVIIECFKTIKEIIDDLINIDYYT